MDKHSDGGSAVAATAVVVTGLAVLMCKPVILLLGVAYLWQRSEVSDDE